MGLTGAGKSTLLPTLLEDARTLLPERREITDRVLLPAAQRMEAVPPSPVSDRLERFRLTARYREEHPEGIVHALVQELNAQPPVGPAVFDGLRGESEVRAAVNRFPDSRFLMLLAGPLTRVKRLMARRDSFDQVGDPASERAGERVDLDRGSARSSLQALLEAVDGADLIFDPADLVRFWQDQPERTEDLLQAVRVVVAEQRFYGEDSARACLEQLPAERRLVIDSEKLGPAQVAERVRTWLVAGEHESRRNRE